MHFLKEACRRKPLESKGLAYSRAATAILMSMLFLAYIGYLISQLYYDNPLIVTSTEPMPDNYTPIDIYLCAEGSTITFNNCSIINKDYDSVPISNCEKYFKFKSFTPDNVCYMFMGDDFKMFVSANSLDDSVRMFDFYWSIDNLDALYNAEPSVPSIDVQLYDPLFNPHRPWGIGDSDIERKTRVLLGQQSQWSPCSIGQTTTIFYSPRRKRIIRPADFRAFFGISPNFIEINDAVTQTSFWPLSNVTPEGYPERSSYQGEVSVQLSQYEISILTETRQHTFLADVALAGGAYGLLTTLYVILFGMNKLTPWGIVHNTNSLITRVRSGKKEKDIEYNDNGDFYGEDNQSKSKASPLFANPNEPRFDIPLTPTSKKNAGNDNPQPFYGNNPEDELLRARPDSLSKTNLYNENDVDFIEIAQRLSVDGSIQGAATPGGSSQADSILNQSSDRRRQATITRRTIRPPEYQGDVVDQDALVGIQLTRAEKRTKELETRVDELEAILSQFFIDTSYLNNIRSKENK